VKQTETPAFKRWFGKSKVVDTSGKPLVVYHGTTADFTEFSDEFGPYRGGILAFFSTSPKFASNYSSFTSGDNNSNVIPVFLKIENPFDYRKDSWLAESFWDETGGITDSYSINQMVEDGDTLTKEKFIDLVKEGSWAALEAEQFVRYLRDGGYDGIVVKEGGVINYAIFKPTQVKSAYGNRGTFDPADPDIRNPRRSMIRSKLSRIIEPGDRVLDYDRAQGEDLYRLWDLVHTDMALTPEALVEIEGMLDDDGVLVIQSGEEPAGLRDHFRRVVKYQGMLLVQSPMNPEEARINTEKLRRDLE